MPPRFLDHFKNPCWYENLTSSDVLTNNSLKLSFEGYDGGPLSRQLKVTQRSVAQCLRQADGGGCKRLRCLPYFYIAGFAKCGTTDLHTALSAHPQIALGSHWHIKEPTYWNRVKYQGKSQHGLWPPGLIC